MERGVECLGARRGGDWILNSDGGGEGKWAGETLRVGGLVGLSFCCSNLRVGFLCAREPMGRRPAASPRRAQS
jgi:hypothetical protein